MKARLLRDMTCRPTMEFPNVRPPGEIPVGLKPTGTIIDHPRAFRLVQMGVAESIDDECRWRANRTPEQMAEAVHAYARTEAGIHPEDFPRYDAGEIAGYNPDGSYIPGPAVLSGSSDEEYDIDDDWEDEE